MIDAMLTVKDVAERLGIQDEAVRELIRKAVLCGVDVSSDGATRKAYRVAPAALEAFEKAREIKARPKRVRRRRRNPQTEQIII